MVRPTEPRLRIGRISNREMTVTIRYRWHRVKRAVISTGLDTLHRRGLVGLNFNYRFLVACWRGVFVYDRGRITRLLRGHYFGMTATDTPNLYYITEYLRTKRRGAIRDERSHILRCRIEGGSLRIEGEMRFHRAGRPHWPVKVHQVRWHEGFLWVANTRQNVVWKVAPDGEIVGEWTGGQRFEYDLEDAGQLVSQIRSSADYHHYNSIAFHDGLVYVLAHNSAKADDSRRSFLVVLDRELREVGRREDIGKACHDVLFHDEDLYVCNSGEGTLLKNFEPVVQTGQFLRGLARIGSILIMGGSVPRVDPTERAKSRSRLFFVDLRTHRTICTLALGRVGDIREIVALED